MKKDFLFYTTSSFTLEPHFFQKGGVPLKKALFASLFAVALGSSTATFGMDLPKDDETSKVTRCAKSPVFDPETYILSEEVMEFFTVCAKSLPNRAFGYNKFSLEEPSSQRCLRGLEEISRIKLPDNTFSSQNFRDAFTYRMRSIGDEQDRYIKLFVGKTRDNIVQIVEASIAFRTELLQVPKFYEIFKAFNMKLRNEATVKLEQAIAEIEDLRGLTPAQVTLVKNLQQRKQIEQNKTTTEDKACASPVLLPHIKSVSTSPKEPKKSAKAASKRTPQSQEKKDLPKDKGKEPVKNQLAKNMPSKVIPPALGDIKEKEEKAAKPSPEILALDTWINSQKYKQKPQLRYTKIKGSIPTYQAALEIPSSVKKKAEILGIGQGTADTNKNAQNTAVQNLLGVLKGEIPVEKTKAIITPKKDKPAPLTVKNQAKLSQDQATLLQVAEPKLDIHAHSMTFEVKAPETPTLSKSKKKRLQKKASLLIESSASNPSSIHPIDIAPKLPSTSSQQQPKPQNPESSKEKGDDIEKVNDITEMRQLVPMHVRHNVPSVAIKTMTEDPSNPNKKKAKKHSWPNLSRKGLQCLADIWEVGRYLTTPFADSDFVPKSPIDLDLIKEANIPFYPTNNEKLVLVDVNAYTKYSSLEAMSASLAKALQSNRFLSEDNRGLRSKLKKIKPLDKPTVDESFQENPLDMRAKLDRVLQHNQELSVDNRRLREEKRDLEQQIESIDNAALYGAAIDSSSSAQINREEKPASSPQGTPARSRTVSAPAQFFSTKVKPQGQVLPEKRRTASLPPSVVSHKKK